MFSNYYSEPTFNTSITCPADGYSQPGSMFQWDWYKRTGCKEYQSQISLTGFLFFTKSYKAYGIWSCVIIGVYAIYLAILFFYIHKFNKSELELSRWILLYNVLIAEISLYFIFKPYQYYDHEFEGLGMEKNIDIHCPIGSTTREVQIWIVVMIVGVVVFTFLDVTRKCISFMECFARRSSQHRSKAENDRLLNAKYERDNTMSLVWFWFGILFNLWILLFFIVLMLAFFQVWQLYDEVPDQIGIVLPTILSFFGMFDALFIGSSREWLKDYLVYTQHQFAKTSQSCSKLLCC